MRVFLYLLCCSAVVGLAYWAYKENYETQASIRRVNDLHSQIAHEREAIAILKAEWAYLNRPERLRELVDLNFNDLKLLPLMPEHFADVELVAYPRLELDLTDISDPISIQSSEEKDFP